MKYLINKAFKFTKSFRKDLIKRQRILCKFVCDSKKIEWANTLWHCISPHSPLFWFTNLYWTKNNVIWVFKHFSEQTRFSGQIKHSSYMWPQMIAGILRLTYIINILDTYHKLITLGSQPVVHRGCKKCTALYK